LQISRRARETGLDTKPNQEEFSYEEVPNHTIESSDKTVVAAALNLALSKFGNENHSFHQRFQRNQLPTPLCLSENYSL
jgi:hypothetical protein